MLLRNAMRHGFSESKSYGRGSEGLRCSLVREAWHSRTPMQSRSRMQWARKNALRSLRSIGTNSMPTTQSVCCFGCSVLKRRGVDGRFCCVPSGLAAEVRLLRRAIYLAVATLPDSGQQSLGRYSTLCRPREGMWCHGSNVCRTHRD